MSWLGLPRVSAADVTVGQQMTEAVKPQVMERQTSGVKLGPSPIYAIAKPRVTFALASSSLALHTGGSCRSRPLHGQRVT